jgi:hypothetical protein
MVEGKRGHRLVRERCERAGPAWNTTAAASAAGLCARVIQRLLALNAASWPTIGKSAPASNAR